MRLSELLLALCNTCNIGRKGACHEWFCEIPSLLHGGTEWPLDEFFFTEHSISVVERHSDITVLRNDPTQETFDWISISDSRADRLPITIEAVDATAIELSLMERRIRTQPDSEAATTFKEDCAACSWPKKKPPSSDVMPNREVLTSSICVVIKVAWLACST